ncbi:HAMP domain-containing protein [bacterium]|nr:HAMP domain-containing protein [bacterium]
MANVETTLMNKIKKIFSSIGDGNFEIDVSFTKKESSSYLELTTAVTKGLSTLNDVISQANEISTGNYEADITPRSEKDQLGIALQRMTEILRNVSLAAEAVAEGDTSIQVVEQGSKDLLAQSFNRMVTTINNAATQANEISTGNYEADITPRSEKEINWVLHCKE